MRRLGSWPIDRPGRVVRCGRSSPGGRASSAHGWSSTSGVGDEVASPGPTSTSRTPSHRRALADARPDAVYHLAAQSSVGIVLADAARTFEVNAIGTLNVLGGGPGLPAPAAGAAGQLGRGVRRGRPGRAAGNRGRPVPARHALRGQQGGGRAGRAPGLPRRRRSRSSGSAPSTTPVPASGPQFVVPALARQIVEAAEDGRRALRTGNLAAGGTSPTSATWSGPTGCWSSAACPGEVYNVCTGRSVAIAELARRLLALAGVELELEVDPERVRPVDVPDMRGDPQQACGPRTGWQP